MPPISTAEYPWSLAFGVVRAESAAAFCKRSIDESFRLTECGLRQFALMMARELEVLLPV